MILNFMVIILYDFILYDFECELKFILYLLKK